MGICDKCGKDVDFTNDATIVSVEAGEFVYGAGAIIGLKSRHFLATDTCEGSPSRNKRPEYLEAHKRILLGDKKTHSNVFNVNGVEVIQ